MPEKKSAKKSTKKSTTRTGKTSGVFSADERAAMKALGRAAAVGGLLLVVALVAGFVVWALRQNRQAGRSAEAARVLTLAAGADRAMATRIHAIVQEAAPDLWARTWYGMPAYTKDGKVVCFFKSAQKFKSRYATFGFEDSANLDQGAMWPTSYALTKLTPADEKKLAALVKKAAR